MDPQNRIQAILNKLEQYQQHQQKQSNQLLKRIQKIINYHQKNQDQDNQSNGFQCYQISESVQFQTDWDRIIAIMALLEGSKSSNQVVLVSNTSQEAKLFMKIVPKKMHNRYIIVQEQFKYPKQQQVDLSEQNPEQLERIYLQSLKKRFGIQDSDVLTLIDISVLDKDQKIVKFVWKTTMKHLLNHYKKQNPNLKISTHQAIKKMPLSIELFDKKIGNRPYQVLGLLETGRYPYYPFLYGTRFAIDIKIHGQCQRWIGNQTQPNAWANVYVACGSQQLQLKQIQARKKDKDGRPYISEKAVNKDTIIGCGTCVYARAQQAAKFSESVIFRSQHQQNYKIVYQCRVHPDSILVCAQNQQYWIIKDNEDIRIYGIILYKKNDLEDMKNNIRHYQQDQFFTWERYRSQILGDYSQYKS